MKTIFLSITALVLSQFTFAQINETVTETATAAQEVLSQKVESQKVLIKDGLKNEAGYDASQLQNKKGKTLEGAAEMAAMKNKTAEKAAETKEQAKNTSDVISETVATSNKDKKDKKCKKSCKKKHCSDKEKS